MLIKVDPAGTEPLFTQLASSVRGAIVRGEVSAGERLPSARDLANSLGVNIHTVLRGYQQLRDEGLLELRRGRGAVVTESAVGGHAELQRSVAEVCGTARRLGLSLTELNELIAHEF